MVRELTQRGVLTGEQGSYVCQMDVTELSVPATVQAAIEARIDRLTGAAKRALYAASVIGGRFGSDLLSALVIDADLDELLAVDLIDQVRSAPSAEYTFRHPLIHAVAYESQLKSDRAEWHRRLAAAIEARAPGAVEENAALIAEHLQAADELRTAYAWHMRAGAWSTNRDLVAARGSWERARRIADAVPADDPDQLSMRIAPRTMLCATDLQAREVQDSRSRYAELRELCRAARDDASLAVGMSALATELMYAGHAHEAARVSSEQMALLESTSDRTPAMGLAFIAFVNWHGVGDFDAILRWSQTIIDLAAGDPAKGAGYGTGSPLAIATAWRGTARWCLGRSGWRNDLHQAIELARRSNPETLSGALAWTYGFAVQYGVLRADDAMVCTSEEALRKARSASSDRVEGLAAYTLAVGLLNQDDADDRDRGLQLMAQTRDLWLRKRAFFLIPATDVWAARETARRGSRDAAVRAIRQAVDELRQAYPIYCLWATGILVETLLERGAQGDVTEAAEAIDELAKRWVDGGSAIGEITLLRLRTLLARARGDVVTYPELVRRYRAMAKSLGYEGHIAWTGRLREQLHEVVEGADGREQ